MKRRFAVLTCLVCLLVVAAPPALAGSQDPIHFPAERPLDIKHIRLDMRVGLKDKTVTSRATVDAVALRRLETLGFDAVGFETSKVAVGLDGASPTDCSYENDGRRLTLDLPQPLPIGGRLRVVIDYRLNDPADGLHFFAPNDEDPDAPLLMWSQGESITNRYWVPCFDHPNEKQTTEILCTVDKPNIAISNGKLLKVKENGDGTRTFHWRQDQPHSAYLMTLVVGQFVSKTVTWRGKPVTYYVRKKYKDWIDNSFAHTPAMLDFFSNKIGVEYAWDKYSQVCCYSFGGGMENTSATTLGERTLHDEKADLDTSSDGLVSHELAHQWWGDLLTCKDWAHIWLNEGFASYFQALWTEQSLGQDEFAYDMLQKARAAIKGGKTKPIVYRNYENPGEQFDARAYPKGAWVLQMIRRKLGDEMFWKAIGTYCKQNKFSAVETVDLRKAIEQVSGYSFERFFYDWTQRPGAPIVHLKYQFLPEDKLAKVRIEQTQKAAAFHFPLRLEFRFDGDRKPFVFNAKIDRKRLSLFIPLAHRPTMLRVDPDNAVLMELTENKPRDLWKAQLADDPNVVARIAAVKHFAKGASAADRALLAGRLTAEPFWGVQSEIAKALGDMADDDENHTARDALLAGLKIDNPKARAAVVKALGEFEDDQTVATALLPIVKDGDPSYRVQANAIVAYADACSDFAASADLWKTLLATNSYRQMIRAAALRAIGKHCNADLFEQLVTWSQKGKPRECRTAAIEAIGTALSKDSLAENGLSDETVEQGLKLLGDRLAVNSRSIRGAALGALGDVGPGAGALLPKIDRMARKGNLRLSRVARRVAEKIRGQQTPKEQLDEMRGDIARLRDENERLEEQMKRLEATGKSPASSSASAE